MTDVLSPAVRVVTFALEAREAGGPSGVAVVCPATRYASALWRGDDRPTRLHLKPAEWLALTTDFEVLAAGSLVDDYAPIARLVADGRALMRCVGSTELRAEPWAMTAALDALLTMN